MRDIFIPQVIYAGRQCARLRQVIAFALLLALLLHVGLFYGLYYLGMHPFRLMMSQKEEPIPDAMQYVLIDESLTSEEPHPDETARMRGRETRRSRAETVDQALPKNGPSAKEPARTSDFQAGKPLPSEAAARPSAPTQPTPPAPATPPTPRPAPAVPPVPPVAQVAQEKPQEKQPPLPEPLEKTADLAPDLAEDLLTTAELTLPKKSEGLSGQVAVKPRHIADATENKKKTEHAEKPEKPEDAARKPVQATPKEHREAKEAQEAKPEEARPSPAQQPSQSAQQPQQPALPPTPPTMNIPVKRIGSTPRRQGGSVGSRSNSSAAMRAASDSMAVLRDKYGEYMDMVLRRIQEAILIQQQLSPMMFNQGTVVMTFHIDDTGRLGTIRFIQAAPVDLTGETAAARRVLEDVGGGAPFPPPTPQMLADPDFQKITIMFMFEPR